MLGINGKGKNWRNRRWRIWVKEKRREEKDFKKDRKEKYSWGRKNDERKKGFMKEYKY